MHRSSVPPDSPPLHWPTLTFYPESSYRPLLSRVAWFVQDRGCGSAAAGTLTVLALIKALGGGFDNDFADNSCLQWWWGGGTEEAGAALNEFVNEGSKIRWPFRSLFSWYVTLWTLCWYLLEFCVFFLCEYFEWSMVFDRILSRDLCDCSGRFTRCSLSVLLYWLTFIACHVRDSFLT